MRLAPLTRTLPVLLAAALLVWLHWRSGVDFRLLVLPVMLLFAYAVIASGRLLLAAAGVNERDPCSEWCVGLLAASVFVYAGTLIVPVTAAAAFAALSAGVIVVRIVLARRAGPGSVPAAADWRALTGFALCVALTLAWCDSPAGAYNVVRTQGVLPVWSDYFFHAGLISQFGDGRSLGRGSIFFADQAPTFYHFASYAPAGALAGVLDQPGLPIAVAAWLPLGFLAMLAGAYALGMRLAGAAGAVAAVAAVAVLPDASNYGLRNGYFSFHWTLMASPGATYALGVAFVSLAFLDRWSSERSRAALIASALLAISTVLFRAHVFLIYFPVWIALTAVCAVRDDERRGLIARLMIAALGASAALGSLILTRLAAAASSWRFGERALDDFLLRVHTGQEPTAYTNLYAELVKLDLPEFTLTAGIMLAVVAALGAFVVLTPAAALIAGRARALRPIDFCCAYLALWWLLLMLFAPVPWHGDPTDLIHRPAVLLYSAVAIWTLCLPLRAIAPRGALGTKVWAIALAGAIVALPALFVGAQTMAHPKFRWGEQDAAVRVAPGLADASAFLREHAAPGDIFAAAGLSADYATFDLSVQLCALTGMPAYLSRPYLEMIKDMPRKQVAAARLAALEQIGSLPDHHTAMQALHRLNIQWYVTADEEGPRWDPARRRAAFRSGTVALYSTTLDRPDLRADER